MQKFKNFRGANLPFLMPTTWEDLFRQPEIDILQNSSAYRLCKTEKLKKFALVGYENRSLDAYTLRGSFFRGSSQGG